jgi:hypothetical protein
MVKNNKVVSKYIFRFYSQPNSKLEKIKVELENYNFEFDIFQSSEEGRNTIIFRLKKDNFNSKKIIDLIKIYKIQKRDFGFGINITSEFDNGGVVVPDWFMKYYCEVGGQFNISYIFL